ncbi:MAG: DNA repair protein RadC [Endomicrobia bacterium]|jgi:DNA repair protein RadC|nr:DNA repair protein RadC [Bacillota bacterium]MCL1972271.1 DNA repair protein RadC [Endomicrobiia bacterium]
MDINNNSKPHYFGHRSRMKDKFLASGFDGFADYEILEFALFFAIERIDVKPLAKELIKKFGSVKQVLDADFEELMKFPGLSRHSAVFLTFLREMSGYYSYLDIKSPQSLGSPEAVVDYLITVLSGEKIEKFYVVLLDAGNKVIESKEIESGTVNKSIVMPRKIAEIALTNKASAVIIAHNHPGGTMKPSQHDIDATAAVKKALKALDISLLDHVIVSGNKYLSFREYNLI